MRIRADKKELMAVDKAIVIGLKGDKNVKLNIQGELSIEEVLDMLNTTLLEMLNTYEHTAKTRHNLTGEDEKKLKEDLYQRAVMGFSLTIDKYHPEGIKTKFNQLTEEAIMEKQDEILSRKSKKT